MTKAQLIERVSEQVPTLTKRQVEIGNRFTGAIRPRSGALGVFVYAPVG